MRINLSNHFKKSYKKLSIDIQKDFDQKIISFIKDPKNKTLRTHKLKGKYQSCLSFRLKNGFRVLFEFPEKDIIDLLDIGSHDIYKKR